MTETNYTLRVAVKVTGREPINGLDEEKTFIVKGREITVKQRWPYLILSSPNFETEELAEHFVGAIKLGLVNLAFERGIAFVPFFERRQITLCNDPVEAGRAFAKTFGASQDQSCEMCHGITDEGGYAIFETGQVIRFISASMTGHLSTSWPSAESALTAAIAQNNTPSETVDSNVSTAVDLYLAHFTESSPRARFLTLVICLEVLAPISVRHPTVTALLEELHCKVREMLFRADDSDEVDSLKALLKEIHFRKETSIRRRIRRLLVDQSQLDEEARAKLADQTVKAYDLRGKVVHTGKADAAKLAEATDVVAHAAKIVLRQRLGLSPI